MIKKINDERLRIKNLENIRILFLIQTLGVIAILVYDYVTKGFDAMTSNPLWFVLIVVGIISAYLSMNISVDYEEKEPNTKKSMLISFVIGVILAVVVGIFVGFQNNIVTGLLTGGIIFVVILLPVVYLNFLRNRSN